MKEDGSLELQWPAAAHKWFSQIIRVGSVSYDGQQYESPRAAHGNYLGARLNTIVDVSAPGDSVECASGQGNGYQTVFGNVYSAAM